MSESILFFKILITNVTKAVHACCCNVAADPIRSSEGDRPLQSWGGYQAAMGPSAYTGSQLGEGYKVLRDAKSVGQSSVQSAGDTNVRWSESRLGHHTRPDGFVRTIREQAGDMLDWRGEEGLVSVLLLVCPGWHVVQTSGANCNCRRIRCPHIHCHLTKELHVSVY
jgi:hypothetical protein